MSEPQPTEAARKSPTPPAPTGLIGGVPTVPSTPPLEQGPHHGPIIPQTLPESDLLQEGNRPGERIGRYEVFGEIGRGGMGAVLRGRDPDLGRDLAIKVLREDYPDRPDLVQRFVEEARVGGQLQHPGVVPIYELGRFVPPGTQTARPYFAMKLIEGRTLADLLAERADRAQDLPRFLGIFQQVCQTLAYAHARRIIHRDLKPLNVMVGAFGEVQVMDWGLAKVLREEGHAERPSPSSSAAPARGPGETPAPVTTAGQVMGTPGYMPPEQARGEVDRLDERSDVFGLGAILCEILTGWPPYTGKGRKAVVHQAQEGDLTDAWSRLDSCGPDAELVALARSCLAPAPADRPGDAGVVAERMTAYLAGVQERLRSAEVARAEALARAAAEGQARIAAQAQAAAERRSRRLTLILTATVLLAVVAGGAGGLWFKLDRDARANAEARQAEKDEGAVVDALQEAERLREGANWTEARAAVARAQAGLADDRLSHLRERVEQADADVNMAAKLDEARLLPLETLGLTFDKSKGDAAYAEAFRGHGLDVLALDPAEAAGRIQASAIREHLIAALDSWVILKDAKDPGRERLLGIARLADTDAWRRQLREPALCKDRAALERLAGRPEVLVQPLATLLLLGSTLLVADARPAGLKVLRQAQDRYPGDFWVNRELAAALAQEKPPPTAEVLAFLRAALAVRPDSYNARVDMGLVLTQDGRLEEAEATFRKALEQQPNLARAPAGLGYVLADEGRVVEAEAACRRAVQLEPNIAMGPQRPGPGAAPPGPGQRGVVRVPQGPGPQPENGRGPH
jgi:serine/threonine-protein kinase